MAVAKQTKIPGTERQKIKAIDKAAEAYVEVRDERMGLTKKEKEAKEKLLSLMKEHKLDSYTDEDASPPLIVTVEAKDETVKVKRASEDETEDDE